MMVDISRTNQTNPVPMIDGTMTNETAIDGIVHDPGSVTNDLVDSGLIEAIWQDLGGRVSYEKIWQTALKVAANYVDARVVTFITIFIRRQTMERLIHDNNKPAS